jgi:hypothetical protein
METLYLWLIERRRDIGYGEYAAAVVAAPNKSQARKIHPGGPDGEPTTWPVKPHDVWVKRLGVADEDIEAGAVLLAKFVAG